ncbi:hypothetical protein JT157_01670, partial [Helicobacter pylori]|nr:hypothetical protein [Helicobacter pylori]
MAIRFGVIFIDNNIDNFFNDRRKTEQQLRSILERKSGLDFIRFIEATSEKIIANAVDLNASCCFITPEDLKTLKERSFIQPDID